MNLGEKLRYFAENNFGSVAKLAEILGMKPPSLYNYLNNESVPGGELLKKIQNLGCDINWLLSTDDSSPPPVNNERLQQLEEENQRLRDSISRLALLTQAEVDRINNKKKPLK